MHTFNLNIKYKPGKENIILDALSRLLNLNSNSLLLSNTYSELDILFTAEDFYNKILND